MRDEAEEAHVGAHAGLLGRPPQRVVARHVVADQHEPQVAAAALRAHEGEGADQPLEVLVGLHVAGEEDEPPVDLVALADPLPLRLAGVDEELGVDRVRDDPDLVGVGRRVEAEDVRAGGLRHGVDERALLDGGAHHEPRVAVGHPVRQVLGEEQVDAVVDRHDRRDRAQERAHVVRRVQQLGPEPPELERDREVLAQAVLVRLVHDGHEVLGEVAQRRLVGLVAEEEVGVVRIEAGEVAHDVADVGADAVVPPLPDVDRDLHGSRPKCRGYNNMDRSAAQGGTTLR